MTVSVWKRKAYSVTARKAYRKGLCTSTFQRRPFPLVKISGPIEAF